MTNIPEKPTLNNRRDKKMLPPIELFILTKSCTNQPMNRTETIFYQTVQFKVTHFLSRLSVNLAYSIITNINRKYVTFNIYNCLVDTFFGFISWLNGR